MSGQAATMNAGNANRRFLLLAVTLGLVGALLVYVAFSRDGSSNSSSSVADTAVVVAKTDIPARTKITASMVEVRLLPAETTSALAFRDIDIAIGQVTRFPIAANEQLLPNKVVPLTDGSAPLSRSLSYIVPPGMRGIAITTNEVQNVGGLVIPGDYVDVIVLYDHEYSSGGELQTVESFIVQTLMQNKEVLAVSQSVVDAVPEATPSASGQRVRNSEARPMPEAQTVTLALSLEEAQKLYLAEGNGRIRFAVRSYGDGEQQPVEFITANELFPRNLPNPFGR